MTAQNKTHVLRNMLC